MEAREWKANAQQLDRDTKAFAQSLAAVVKRRREALGWNPEILAVASGVSRETIRLIESGKSAPTVKTLFRLGRAMGVPSRKLIAEAEISGGFPTRNGYQEPEPAIGIK